MDKKSTGTRSKVVPGNRLRAGGTGTDTYKGHVKTLGAVKQVKGCKRIHYKLKDGSPHSITTKEAAATLVALYSLHKR